MKLLAVLVLASGVAHADTPRLLRDGRPAAGNTMGKTPASDDETPEPAPQLTLAEESAVRDLRDRLLAAFTSEPVAVPRTIHGRPACGNVTSRAPRRRDC